MRTGHGWKGGKYSMKETAGREVGAGSLWGYLGTGLNVVLDHRDPRHWKQGFGHLKRQRPEASPLLRASNQDHSFEHDGNCYLNLKSQQRNQAQIPQPSPGNPTRIPSKPQTLRGQHLALSQDVNPKFDIVPPRTQASQIPYISNPNPDSNWP